MDERDSPHENSRVRMILKFAVYVRIRQHFLHLILVILLLYVSGDIYYDSLDKHIALHLPTRVSEVRYTCNCSASPVTMCDVHY